MFAALRLADLRVRQGRVDEAERLLEGGEWHPTARRLAATIALVRGDAALASELGELFAEGSPLADPTGAPALELLVATRLAIGDVARALEAADRLATVAQASGVERLQACGVLAQGRVAAARGETRAVAQLKRAAARVALDGYRRRADVPVRRCATEREQRHRSSVDR
jgi:ATP/maltotriose-dependent transcriptional regulator MalT